MSVIFEQRVQKTSILYALKNKTRLLPCLLKMIARTWYCINLIFCEAIYEQFKLVIPFTDWCYINYVNLDHTNTLALLLFKLYTVKEFRTHFSACSRPLLFCRPFLTCFRSLLFVRHLCHVLGTFFWNI